MVGYSPSISYAFDRHTDKEVQTDIIRISDEELIGSDAVRNIVVVDIETGEAVKRAYAVIPSTEGDNINVYTYSGNFKCKGELVMGTAESSDNWQTCTFTPKTEWIDGEAADAYSVGGSDVHNNDEQPETAE